MSIAEVIMLPAPEFGATCKILVFNPITGES